MRLILKHPFTFFIVVGVISELVIARHHFVWGVDSDQLDSLSIGRAKGSQPGELRFVTLGSSFL